MARNDGNPGEATLPATDNPVGQKYAQVLGHQERILAQIVRIRDELAAPVVEDLLHDIRVGAGSEVPHTVRRVTEALEEVIRSIQLCQSEVQKELLNRPGRLTVDGVPNLPASLGRFLAERAEAPDFRYEVEQDEIRGWVIRWRELGPEGMVRGAGRFYERPYAWLDE